MKQRHQLLSQAKMYLQNNPGDAQLSVEELRVMVGTASAEQVMKRVLRYASRVQGSSQYLFHCYQELQALLEQKGAPTFFLTLSSADNYWPEFHHLMPHPADNPTHMMRTELLL